jgi:cytochrome c5
MKLAPTTNALALAVATLAVIGCGGNTHAPAAAKAPEAAAKASEAPFNVGSIFPPGEGRELVLSTCGACHSVVCSTRGQRTAERWDSIRASHQDKLTGQSAPNVATMFAYLKQNFNETKPEPKVPAELAEPGCTPF